MSLNIKVCFYYFIKTKGSKQAINMGDKNQGKHDTIKLSQPITSGMNFFFVPPWISKKKYHFSKIWCVRSLVDDACVLTKVLCIFLSWFLLLNVYISFSQNQGLVEFEWSLFKCWNSILSLLSSQVCVYPYVNSTEMSWCSFLSLEVNWKSLKHDFFQTMLNTSKTGYMCKNKIKPLKLTRCNFYQNLTITQFILLYCNKIYIY